jgi:hypothetical protein
MPPFESREAWRPNTALELTPLRVEQDRRHFEI